MRNKALITLIACVVTLLSVDVMACGESLFRVGKGLTYREYTAPFPGNILVVAKTEGELAMVDRLIAAGHRVDVVSDPADISERLENGHYDIVMSRYSQAAIVETQVADNSVSYLPVAEQGTEEKRLAEAAYKRSLSTDDSLKTFLKTIHRTLKDKET
jgi:hypothetical protein